MICWVAQTPLNLTTPSGLSKYTFIVVLHRLEIPFVQCRYGHFRGLNVSVLICDSGP